MFVSILYYPDFGILQFCMIKVRIILGFNINKVVF